MQAACQPDIARAGPRPPDIPQPGQALSAGPPLPVGPNSNMFNRFGVVDEVRFVRARFPPGTRCSAARMKP